MRLQKISVLAALPLAMALTLTACGGDEEKPGVATVNNGKQAGSTGGATLSPGERGAKYAECMRKNGVPMDDPKPGGGIQLKLDGKTPKSTVDKAQEACREFNPMQDAAPGSDPEAEKRSLQFAECMRKNGVEKFPNPKPGQRGVMINKEQIGDDPDLEAAQKACMSIMQRGGANGGGAGQ
ncbi:hypothetical protein [Actinomadura rudentiformis]|uniref:Uncharacterized protein n=1 Tax=Actinomadura rudentiformis TaxID=359158 RepID=A0A6H9YX09_9ACTN|nr:hypothetical protein [Actinomadura rudentiformis]KAB2350745.1 hypothetical protein F8566_07110 [Actinomadura rudentiformis]